MVERVYKNTFITHAIAIKMLYTQRDDYKLSDSMCQLRISC
jgi:hypothetical protein